MAENTSNPGNVKEEQNVQATGTLTIHGVDKEIQVSGIIRILQNDIELVSEFNVNISDFALNHALSI